MIYTSCWLTSLITHRCLVCQLTPSCSHVISMSEVRSGLWVVAAIKSVSYYVKYFDMDSFSFSTSSVCRLIPNLGGNRLTNDGKMAMNEGESDARKRRWGKKGDFFYWCACLLIPKTTMMMNLNTTAKNHSGVSCSTSSYRSRIIRMTLFCCCCF